MSVDFDKYYFDAIVVGGGGSGLSASLKLGDNVAVVSKVFPTRSHTVAAQGGINAALGNSEGEDDWRWHMYDTIVGSDWLADQDAVEHMCKLAPETIIDLERMGLPFSRDENGKIYQRAFGGQTTNYGGDLAHRTCCAADRTGHAMLHTLYQKNVQKKTNFFNEWYALDLLRNTDGDICGVMAIEIETGRHAAFHAPHTILATGGAGKIYYWTTNAYTCTGDGLGMVARASLPLQDMEMWQFHPTGIAGSGVLITEGTRGEGGYLINKDGERYMERYAPHLKDLSCRDVVSRCSLQEIAAGRGCGPNGDYMLLKLDHLGEEVLQERLPGITELAKTFAGVDPAKDPIPVVPTCHYMMGGIPTNKHCQVLDLNKDGSDRLVKGLFAVGECASVSVHGANRLGANSLLDLVVFGAEAGREVADLIENGSDANYEAIDYEYSLKRTSRWLHSPLTKGYGVAEVRLKMQNIMNEYFGVFREGKNMEIGLAKLREVEEMMGSVVITDRSTTFNTALIEALELENLLIIAGVSARGALRREESRGAHSRTDFTERDDVNWLCHYLQYLGDEDIYRRKINMQPLETEPVKLAKREH